MQIRYQYGNLSMTLEKELRIDMIIWFISLEDVKNVGKKIFNFI